MSKILIFLTLILALSMKSFISTWVMMEINLISFLLWQFSVNDQISMIKYFLIQSFFSISMLFLYLMIIFVKNSTLLFNLFIFILLSKLGTPPLYLWFVNFCSSAKFQNLFLVSTLQKVIPLLLIFTFNNYISKIWMLLIMAVTIFGVYRALHIKKILAFSSMFNLIWIFLAMKNLNLMLLFLVLYTLNLGSFILFTSLPHNTQLLSDLYMNMNSTTHMQILFILMTSMMGMPPFNAFFAKIMVLDFFIINHFNQMVFLSLLLFTNMFMIFVYFRMAFIVSTFQKFGILTKFYSPHKTFWLLIIMNIFPAMIFL